MDFPALIAALPAEIVTAVSGTPQGLTLAAQVYVADKRRALDADQEAWLKLEDDGPEPGAHVLGGDLQSHRFELRMSRKDGTRPELQVWARQIRAHFHGRRQPAAITDLVACQVEDQIFDEAPGGSPDVELLALLNFVGVERPSL